MSALPGRSSPIWSTVHAVGVEQRRIVHAVLVLPSRRIGRDEAAECLAVLALRIVPVLLDGVPEPEQAFGVRVAVLDDETFDLLGVTEGQPVANGRAVIHHVERELLDLQLLHELLDHVASASRSCRRTCRAAACCSAHIRDSRGRSLETTWRGAGSGSGTCWTKSESRAGAAGPARRRDPPRGRRCRGRRREGSCSAPRASKSGACSLRDSLQRWGRPCRTLAASVVPGTAARARARSRAPKTIHGALGTALRSGDCRTMDASTAREAMAP